MTPGKQIKIFWHHVGREHGMGEYAPDIRANSMEIVDDYLTLKEARCEPNGWLYDADTLVERGPDSIIVYFADLGLQYSRGHKPYPGWLVDVVSVAVMPSGAYCIRDLFLDIRINDDGTVKIEDADEFEFARVAGVLTDGEVQTARESLALAVAEFKTGYYVFGRLRAVCIDFDFPFDIA